jgi:hypothetical protein
MCGVIRVVSAMSAVSPHPREQTWTALSATSEKCHKAAYALTPCAPTRRKSQVGLDESSTIDSITLGLAWCEAHSLRSHPLYILTKFVNFLIEPCVLRFRRIAPAQFLERFLNGEFGGFCHGNPSSVF